MKNIREFWIARIKDYDCISDINPPENAMHKDKYIRVVAVDDLQFEIGMGLTRYSQVMKTLQDANEKIKELEATIKGVREINDLLENRIIEVCKENAELLKSIEFQNGKMFKKNQQLAIATETLEKIKDTYFDNNGPYVREKSNEALTKIKALK